MKPASIADLPNLLGQEVSIHGWVAHHRPSGNLIFIELRDGSGVVQCVAIRKDLPPEIFERCKRLSQESSLAVSGRVRRDERAPGGVELGVTGLQVIQLSQEFPISPKEHGVDFLLDHRHLWLRSSRQAAILRIRSRLVRSIRDFLDQNGFVLVDAPILTANACEGTTSLFKTDYFGQPAFLSQSGQLYNEAAAMALGRVYCFGPTFRAELSNTRRHLTEFWMVEPEAAFFNLEDDMALAENLVCYIVQQALAHGQRDLAILERDTEPLKKIVPPFPRLSCHEAAQMLRDKGTDFKAGTDLGGNDETLLSQTFDKPVIIHRYPAAVKAFYMKNDPQNQELALCMDMLAPEGYGEIVGGGQREDCLQTLERKIEQHKLSSQVFNWYLDLRRYGSVPHAGFGLGIERTVAWLCGLKHVRETIPFPRLLNRLSP